MRLSSKTVVWVTLSANMETHLSDNGKPMRGYRQCVAHRKTGKTCGRESCMLLMTSFASCKKRCQTWTASGPSS